MIQLKRPGLWIVLAALLASGSTQAESTDLDHIEDVLVRFDRLDLEFEQYVHGAEGELVEFATGRFIMERPKFRWMVDEPYPQTIVSDGEWLRVYDPDLEQLTRSALTEALEGTPLGILSRRDGHIRDEFDLLTRDRKAGADYYMLVPRKPQSRAQRVELWLDGDLLRRLDVTDEFGGRLRLQFKQATAAAWNGDPWVLEVPPGTDVIDG